MPCPTCEQETCEDCFQEVGCLCSRATGLEAVVEGFVTDPGQGKMTTLDKVQKKKSKAGAEKFNLQDTAMWSALSGRVSGLKKLLFVIAIDDIFYSCDWTCDRIHRTRSQCIELHS
jgi:hypothetical protein